MSQPHTVHVIHIGDVVEPCVVRCSLVSLSASWSSDVLSRSVRGSGRHPDTEGQLMGARTGAASRSAHMLGSNITPRPFHSLHL